MNNFVIHSHTAHKAGHHHDLRLESGDALLSWAIPKGVPTSKGQRHLAIQVQDHPIRYRGFEGVIKEGYGAGNVEIYDEGVYRLVEGSTKDHLIIHFSGENTFGIHYLHHWQNNHWLIWRA